LAFRARKTDEHFDWNDIRFLYFGQGRGLVFHPTILAYGHDPGLLWQLDVTALPGKAFRWNTARKLLGGDEEYRPMSPAGGEGFRIINVDRLWKLLAQGEHSLKLMVSMEKVKAQLRG